MKRRDLEEREDNTVRESLAELQRQLDAEDAGGDDDDGMDATVLQPNGITPTFVPQAVLTPAPQRPTPVPQRPTPMPMQAVAPTPMPMQAVAPQRPTPMPMQAVAPQRPTPMPPQRTSAPVIQQHAPSRNTPMPSTRATPPYGAPVMAHGTPAIAPVTSGFDETMLGVSDSFSEDLSNIENATQVASASYDEQAAAVMMFAATPPPVAPSQFEPAAPVRPSMRIPTPYPPPEAPVDHDMQARLARLQGLSLERPATASALPSSSHETSKVGSKLPWILLALVIIGGGFYHFRAVRSAEQSAKSAPAASAPTPTSSEPSRPGSLLASGYIAARAPITLSATTSGRLKEVKVDAGDTITKGQILALLGDGHIRAELSLAGARVRDAGRLHHRTAMLVKAQAATPSDLERAVGAVEVARAEMRVIEQKLEETRIRSPINGTVLEVLARSGEALTLGPNQSAAILRIADLTALNAEVDVAEAELKNVYIGQEAEVTTDAQRGRTFKGVVREIAEQADRARGTVLVKVDIVAEATPPEATEAGSAAEPKPEPPVVEPPKPEPPKPAPPKPAAKGKKGKKGGKVVAKETPKPEPEPSKEEAPKPPPTTGLRPGMAVQVRFIAKTS